METKLFVILSMSVTFFALLKAITSIISMYRKRIETEMFVKKMQTEGDLSQKISLYKDHLSKLNINAFDEIDTEEEMGLVLQKYEILMELDKTIQKKGKKQFIETNSYLESISESEKIKFLDQIFKNIDLKVESAPSNAPARAQAAR